MPAIQAATFLAKPSAAALRAPAILIAGDESYLIEKVVKAVLDGVLTTPGADQFDLDRREAAGLDGAGFDALVSTLPLLNDRRVVVIQGVHEAGTDLRDRIKATLAEAPASLCLIGVGAAAMRGTLYQEWEKRGARIVCSLPRKSPRSNVVDFDFAKWLEQRAKADFGKRLERDAAVALAEAGSELQLLYRELEKAALHAGDAERITRADVEAVCAAGAVGTVWEWCDAVAAKNAPRALTLLGVLLTGGESAYRLVPLLATHFCRLGVVMGLRSRDAASIQAALPGRTWPAMARSLAEQARHHSPASVARALDRLAAADLMLKSSSHGEAFVMHRHLLEILHAA